MINKILDFINQNNLIPQNSKIVLGLSGGPDSVFLLYLLKELQKKIKFELIAAHLDHEWRKNSYLDSDFCKKLTSELNIPFFIKKASELEMEFKFKGSKEELGRQMRRFLLEQIAKEQNADRIALAHHLQDQEENFFIRLIRGTTLSGLVGMKPLDGIYIRPLLEINKADIISYLKENKIDYITDPSNESPEFLRNRIRNTVIPPLRECDKRFDENFLRTLNKLKETENFLEKLTKQNFEEISSVSGKTFTIDLNKFFNLDEFMQRRIIFYWLYKSKVKFELTEQFIHEILRFLKKSGSGKHQIHHEWEIAKESNFVKIVVK